MADERKTKAPEWAARFKIEMKAKGLNLETIAARIPVAASTLRHWTNGTRDVSITDFMRLCKAADIDPSVVLFEDAPNDDGITKSDQILASKINKLKKSKHGQAALVLIENTFTTATTENKVIEKAFKTKERPRIGGVISRPTLFNDDFSGPRRT